MNVKNLVLAIRNQSFKEWFITGNAWGIFSINSHKNQHTGKMKVSYSSKESADKAANSLNKKNNENSLVSYKCAFCDGWHIGHQSK